MNRHERPGLVRLIALVALVALAWTAAAGCRNAADRYMTDVVPREQLRSVEPLDLEGMAAPEKEAEPAVGEPPGELTLTLEECRATALRNNLDLKVALLSPTIANETVNQEEARFEALFFANAGMSKTDAPVSSDLSASQDEVLTGDVGIELPLRTGGSITLDLPVTRYETNSEFSTLNPAYTSDFSLSLAQPLLRGAGTRANTYAVRIARYEAQIAESRTKLEVIRVIADIDRIYWRLYAARRELEVRKSEYDLAVAQLERARRKVRAGMANEIEVTSAETGVAERLEGVIIADNNLRRRERDLKRALSRQGLAMDTRTVVVPATEPAPVRYALDTARLVEGALLNRMEMVELEFRIAQDAATIDFQRNQALPALALSYRYNVNGLGPTLDDAFELLWDKRFEDHSIGLQLQVPLGNEAARSRLRQAVFTRAQRLATRQARREQIRQEVLNAADQLETNWQRVTANRQRTVLAGRNMKAEERRFELGLGTSTDVLDAQTRLGAAQSAGINSLAEYQIALVDLAYATGTLLGAARIEWEPIVPQTE